MKKVSLVYIMFLLPLFCFSQQIDGLWVNEKLRTAIVKNTLQSQCSEKMKPMFMEISKGKVALFLSVEPSVNPVFNELKKMNKNTYTNGLATFVFINENKILYRLKNNEIIFIRNKNNDYNDIFDTSEKLTENYINYLKIRAIKHLQSEKEYAIQCKKYNEKINCKGERIDFFYKISSSNPYYYKKWNALKFYIDIIENGRKNTYRIIKKKPYILSKRLRT